MKLSLLLYAIPSISLAYCTACPFQALRRSGMLSQEEIAKFDSFKRDPALASEHLNAGRDSTMSTNEKRQGLLGGLLGGGLCE